ncbi:response regulator transcription factor [Paracoccus sp. SCSIO 75233]|uniref:response regulator n=1 Tax=Paracoccus sp. SCSIO 75233 TaxID=3017782 RepID=UPI0022F0E233|nr:response regulator transcription factor [Paracoccus sp. SCSIO 75233]WBU53057.1 response regulator transcription factor [Paracoccus sp. SCSIO 75233]
MNILLLEDDKVLAEWTIRSLSNSGHVVDHLEDGRSALIAATTRDYDLIILDRMVPELDGMAVLRTLRASKVAAPVLMLTALGDVEDRVEGLEAGADDYLTKPFAQSELLARVMALGRRNLAAEATEPSLLRYADLELDLLRQKCRRAGRALDLNPKELRLIEAFLRAPGRVLTRTMLLERVWQLNFDPGTNVVDTYVSRLRAKIDRPFPVALIRTVRGAGYVLGD